MKNCNDHNKVITKENGNLKVKIEINRDYVTLYTMRNGFQWTGQPINKELAKLTIQALQEYICENKRSLT